MRVTVLGLTHRKASDPFLRSLLTHKGGQVLSAREGVQQEVGLKYELTIKRLALEL